MIPGFSNLDGHLQPPREWKCNEPEPSSKTAKYEHFGQGFGQGLSQAPSCLILRRRLEWLGLHSITGMAGV